MNAPGGFAIHDPDVVLTDLALALLGAYLGWRLWTAPDRGPMTRTGVVIMGALASAAFWGAMFHAFFPGGTALRPRIHDLGPGRALDPGRGGRAARARPSSLGARVYRARARHAIVAAYAAAFAAVALLIDASFATIVRFYAPVVFLFLIVAGRQAVRSRSAGWTLIAVSFAISLLAAGLQQARVSIHEHFDHNAVYHVLQGVALVLLYRGFRRAEAA